MATETNRISEQNKLLEENTKNNDNNKKFIHTHTNFSENDKKPQVLSAPSNL